MTDTNPRLWAYMGLLPQIALEDPPVKDAAVRRWTLDTEANAAAQGYTLGEPTYSEHPSVLVEGWSKDEEWSVVSPDVARLAGLDPDTLPPGPTVVRIEWPILPDQPPELDLGIDPLPPPAPAPPTGGGRRAGRRDRDGLSDGQRLTRRQHADIAAGKHPLTGEPARPDLGTCGGCIHRVLEWRYPNCDHPETPSTRSAATDVRAFWPACHRFTPKKDSKS